VTDILRAWSEGVPGARERLVPLVYQELRRRAAACLRRERRAHTLQPTALVHEVYMRMVNQDRIAWRNRAQFFGVAAEMMRRILVDRARAHRRAKRSGRWARISLDPELAVTQPIEIDVLDLDAALARLAEFDPRRSRMAELRFFAGLSLDEAAEVLGISRATAERDWTVARAWLFDALSRGTARDRRA
jgi:RNA polymerase sigma factor (TIGR02999 family)